LAESIREEGVIVPVKVRKNGDGYILVYGHRRVAAAKMAGLTEIEVIVEDVSEKKLLTQALIENVVREGMPGIEVAKALAGIISDTGCTHAELAAKMGWAGEGTVSNYLGMLAPELGLLRSGKLPPVEVTVKHVQEAKAGTDSLKDAAKVLKYAGEHGDDGEVLSARKTRQVAEVVRKAADFGGDKAVTRVLAQPPEQIIATAGTFAKRKTAPPKVRKVEGTVLFQWTKSPRVILAEEGLKIAKEIIVEISHSEQDRGGGKAAIKRIVALADAVAVAGRKALEKM
jgi:ParB-like chromosome segregation protein Spo0J